MSDKQPRRSRHQSRREFFLTGGPLLAMTALGSAISKSKSASAQAAGTKPNILVIFGDDIGWWNTSAYNRGQMGYQTPNIDRIADEGAIFTDLYAQQSCTAGRAAFITGQSCFRTFVARHLQTYVEFPPRQKPGSFALDQVLAKLQEAGGSGKH